MQHNDAIGTTTMNTAKIGTVYNSMFETNVTKGRLTSRMLLEYGIDFSERHPMNQLNEDSRDCSQPISHYHVKEFTDEEILSMRPR